MLFKSTLNSGGRILGILMNILFMDDNPRDLAQLGKFLEEAGGHKIFFASNPSRGRQILEETEIDVVVSDYCCPLPRDGEAFIGHVRNVVKKPIAVLSSSAFSPRIVRLLKGLGADECVDKLDADSPAKILAFIARHATSRQQ